MSDETRLHNDMFSMKRDTHPTTKPMTVRFGLTLMSVVDYDAAGEEVSTLFFCKKLAIRN